MKMKFLSAIIALCVVAVGTAKADNVDLQTAKQVAAHYFTQATGAKAPVTEEAIVLAEEFDNPTLCIPSMYAFNVAGNGFVVVSASDCVEPILAYSPTGDIKNINPACRYMLESYANIIADHQNAKASTTREIAKLWSSMIDQTYTCTPDLSKAVLVKSKWDQGENYNPTYNFFCPVKNGKYCYTGCVATAMAMIIHYWKYPVKGGSRTNHTVSCPWNGTTQKYKFQVDSNKFVYDSMPNSLTVNSPWNNIRAVAKLSYACGVTVKMGWDPNGSGAQSSDVDDALVNWFNYQSMATYRERKNTSDETWVNMLHQEIDDHSRPVYYSGRDTGSGGRDAGHAFVIAGTSNNDRNKFYINWGWGGNANGFFTLAPRSSIETASGYTFKDDHAVVYKIQPSENSIEENTSFCTTTAYPNPTSEYLMIPADANYNMRLSVYSIDGKMVDNVVVPAGTQEYRLDVRNYPTGTYFYRFDGNAYKFVVE